MIITETPLFEGPSFWGDFRLVSNRRQSLVLECRRHNTDRWVPVIALTTINGQLVFHTHGKEPKVKIHEEGKPHDATQPRSSDQASKAPEDE